LCKRNFSKTSFSNDFIFHQQTQKNQDLCWDLSGFWELSGFFLRLSGYFWFKKNWYLLLQYSWQREISKNPKSCENLKTSWNFSAKKFFSENCKNHVFLWFNGFFYKKWQKYFCFDMPTTFPNIFSKNALGNLNSVYLPNFSVILFFKQNFTFAFFFSYKKHDKSHKIVCNNKKLFFERFCEFFVSYLSRFAKFWKILPDKWIYLKVMVPCLENLFPKYFKNVTKISCAKMTKISSLIFEISRFL
jgi:hypothetical protein